MSIRLIVTRGFGNGTFAGNINDIVTRGYGIGATEITDAATFQVDTPPKSLNFRDWVRWFSFSVFLRIKNGPFQFEPYTVANLPNAVKHKGAQVFVTDETGGAVLAFSDGINWRRVTDREVVS